MRIRKKKWAAPELSVCDFFVKNPEEHAGKWRDAFKKNQPLCLVFSNNSIPVDQKEKSMW